MFFNKAPSDIETINDLDYDVVNLFECIRDNPGELARRVMTVPFSRLEYEHAFYESQKAHGKIEKATQFLTKCWQ